FQKKSLSACFTLKHKVLLYRTNKQTRSSPKIGAGHSEPKQYHNMRKLKLYQSILAVAIGTLSLLMIPWIAMFFTDSVQWSVIDFVIMGILLFSTGLAYVLVTRQST